MKIPFVAWVLSKLKFTIEVENNITIAFLDTKIIRLNKNNLHTNWYHKPADSGRYISYFSKHLKSQLINAYVTMKHFKITTTHILS